MGRSLTLGQRAAILIGMLVVLAAVGFLLWPYETPERDCSAALTEAFREVPPMPEREEGAPFEDLLERSEVSRERACHAEGWQRIRLTGLVTALSLVGVGAAVALLDTVDSQKRSS